MNSILRGMVRGVASAALLAGAAVVLASPTGYSVRSDVDRKLYSIDMATGVATELGATGFSKLEGLAINEAGDIYGVNPPTAQLVKCSPTVGTCTAVGVLSGLPPIQTNAGLTFSSTGVLYLAMNAVIYRVDPATATTAALGTTGPALSGLAGVSPTEGCPSGVFGMGGNSDKGKLYCINVTNGVATFLGTLSIAPLDVGLDGDMGSGLVWGVTNDVPGKVFAVTPSTLVVSNVNTVTLDGKEIGGFESLAIAPTRTSAVAPTEFNGLPTVPTLSLWMLMLLAALTAVIGVVVARRRC